MIKQRISSLINAFKNSDKNRGTGKSRAIIKPELYYTEEYLDELFVSIIQKIGVETDVFLIHGEESARANAVINYAYEEEGYYTLTLDSKNFIGKERNDADTTEISNLLSQKLMCAKIRENTAVIDRLMENSKSWAYWAYNVISEYKAICYAHEHYPMEEERVKNIEKVIKNITLQYYKPNPKEGYEDIHYIESYFNIASAIITHSIINPEFPSPEDEVFAEFVSEFMKIVKTAAPAESMTYHDYKETGLKLRDSFKLLVKNQAPAMRKGMFANFCANAHMADI